ncbi:MAG TPA: PepSY domain-containing protein [Vicinamibacterales bacterium]|nr:PepSY domain-containing protein [Vicinamibacterales bacterium]
MMKRSVFFIHRWLGVSVCLFFLLWFPSGIGMMYWDFPSVTAADRLDRSAALDPSTIRLSPADAYAVLNQTQAPLQARLNTFDGRPAYRFRTGPVESLVFADTGARQGEAPDAEMERVASAWVGQPASAASLATIDEADQWTVQGLVRAQWPLRKFSWPNGEQVYVSPSSGEVVQYTTSASRIGAYLGPIPHWIYFTPLRAHQPVWSQLVIWSSGVGAAAAMFGLVVGVWMYSPSKRYRIAGVQTSIPYRGQKRWHAIFGLLFGLGAVTWAFSGMLSMDPFPARPTRPRADVANALRDPLQLTAFNARDPRQALALLPGLQVKELELMVVAGEPLYLAALDRDHTRIVPVAAPPRQEFDRQQIVSLVNRAAQPDGLVESQVIRQYDAYYLDRHRRKPLPVILARVNDAERTRYYIDPKTARVVGRYGSGSWMERWLYHGLHSLDFPWLYDHRPLWDIVVIAFMLGGTALGVTSLILAWRVIGSHLPTG